MILKGKVFISTVSIHRLPEIRNIFEPLGADIIDFPMTELTGVEQSTGIKKALNRIKEFQWIIFTSANGVKHFHRLLTQSTGLSGIPTGTKIAVIGDKTAQELTKYGRSADFSDSGNSAKNLVIELMKNESLKGFNILLSLGTLAQDGPQKLLAKIANVTRIDVYKTVKTEPTDNGVLDRIRNNSYDLILFTSPSGIMNFAEVIGSQYLSSELWVAAIGKITASAAEKFGLRCNITAETSSYEGLADEIIKFYYKTKN